MPMASKSNKAAVAASSGGHLPDSSLTFSCPEEVVQRVAQQYGDERLADVVFLVQHNEDCPAQRFVAHRNIVSSWSRPLESMLCGSFAEGFAREVRLLDVDPSAFEVMLKLMYTGAAEITADNVLAILDVSVRFDVVPLTQFSVQFLQNNTTNEHSCHMLEVAVQYGLVKLVDKCIELIVTDDHILNSEDFYRLSQAAVIELAKHDSWNLHEDEIYDTLLQWASSNSSNEEELRCLAEPILEHLRYPHMSVEKLKLLSTSTNVATQLIFEALFYKLQPGGHEDQEEGLEQSQDQSLASHPSQSQRQPNQQAQVLKRYRPRPGSLLFSWLPTSRITVSGDYRENARHTSSNGFTGVRGDRRMMHGTFTWTVDIAETQSAWIFVGVAQADDPHDVAWRSTGHMLYCLDSRFFHRGSGQNHPSGDRKICSGDCIRVVLDCTRHTLAFGINNEKPVVLFRDMEPTCYVPAVDLRDCGDKVRILSSRSQAPCTSDPSPPRRRCAAPAAMGARAHQALMQPQPQPQPKSHARHPGMRQWRQSAVDDQLSSEMGREQLQQRASGGRNQHEDEPFVTSDIQDGPPAAELPAAQSREEAAAAAAASVVSTVTAAAISSVSIARGGGEAESMLPSSQEPPGPRQASLAPHALGTMARSLQPRQSQGHQGGLPPGTVPASSASAASGGYPGASRQSSHIGVQRRDPSLDPP